MPRRAARVVRLKPSKDFVFQGVMEYRIAYDYAAGHKDRYTVYINCTEAPLLIGRELDLPFIRELIADYEAVIKTMPGVSDTRGGWSGRNQVALECQRQVRDIRFEKMKKGRL